MAVIHKPGRTSGSGKKKQLGLVLIIGLTLMVMLASESHGLTETARPIIPTALAVAAFFALVALKQNPLFWIPVLKRDHWQQNREIKSRTIAGLTGLGDQCHIFHGLTLEFFKIDFLIVSPFGIFVIKAAPSSIGEDKGRLDRETARLWQRCHMIRMLIKKGYSRDLMPVPLIATDGEYEHNGVRAMTPGMISGRIQN